MVSTKGYARLFSVLILTFALFGFLAEPVYACDPGTSITANKTAQGFWTIERGYDWTLEKEVNASELVIGSGGEAELLYTIDANRTLTAENIEIGVRGQICVKNTGAVPTANLRLEDRVQYKTGSGPYLNLPGATQTIIPTTQLAPNQMQCYPYEIVFTPVQSAQYRNVVNVTITNHSGHMGVPWGPEPKVGFVLPGAPSVSETDEAANVTDAMTCPLGFNCNSNSPGSWYFEDSGSASYDVIVSNVEAECNSNVQLNNTAVLTESNSQTQVSDSASVAIYTEECPPEAYCGDGIVNVEGEECDDNNTVSGDGCSANCALEPVTIIAQKIVCANEADLPNWAAGGPDITATTASDFLAQHEKECWLEPWSFQWAQADASNPGDNTGEAGAGWTTFNGASGTATATINEVTGDRIWMREVWNADYIPFTGQNTVEDVSAEIYCYQDVLNYDNYDYIITPERGRTYYCVAWNVHEQEEPAPCNPELELVANGGFETPIVTHNALWDIFPSGTPDLGWNVEWQTTETSYNDRQRPEVANLELQRLVNGWMPAAGEQYSELDSDWFGPNDPLNGEPASVRIYQDLATVPGREYTVKFQFSPRPSTDTSENVLELSWDGGVQATLSADGSANGNTVWTPYEYNFTATGTVTRLQFADVGTANSLGTFVDGVSAKCTVPEEPRPYCGDGIVQETEACDDGNQVDGDGCSANCALEPVTIIAQKIVCANEADLPNWGNGGPDMNVATATEFLAQHPNCHLAAGWDFQWGYAAVSNPGDNTGEASAESGWNTFGPTNENGTAIATVALSDSDTLVKMREVFKSNYLPFAYDAYGNSNDTSAEIYCYQDVLNYDNYDWIQGPVRGQTYYCVAWNVPLTYCGDKIVQQENGEECDDGNQESGDGCSSECTIELEKVSPILECVRYNNDETYTAFFGYNNPNAVEIPIAIGDENKFAPEPQDRGQPTAFAPGRSDYYPNANFSVLFDGSALVWTLNGETATASDNSEQMCRPICGNAVLEGEEQCDDGNNVDGDGCSANCALEPVTIVATKIVCDNEADLPNWAVYGPDITSTTAFDFLAQHEGCKLAEGWQFQWANYGPVGFPDDNSGEASAESGWNTFGPTNASGQASVNVQIGDIKNIGLREVRQEGYIPFSLDYANDTSAEFYCHVDVLGYDNREVVGALYEQQGLVPGKTYYCVAWNVPECENRTLKYSEGGWWASSVVSSEQGKKKDGGDVPPERSNSSAALGPAQGSGAQYDDGSQTPIGSFYSLGFGGDIVVGFGGYLINGPGNDVQIYETTWAPPGYPLEKARVYASQNGVDWVDLGEVERDGSVDLGSLEWASYIKIVDTSDPAPFDGSGDAYDLDAVKAFYLSEVLDYQCNDQARTYCGDGKVQNPNSDGEYEECDGGERCDKDCTLHTFCGDGLRQTPNDNGEEEECDGGPLCYANCTNVSYCGDGIVQSPNNNGQYEECDGQNLCYDNCTWMPYCGDKIVQENEQCDDGNYVEGDGCSAQCMFEEENGNVTIVAHKIVCDNEADLPNWAYNSEATINSETAADWVAQHESCRFVDDWLFQWALNYPDVQFPDGNSGEAGTPWTTFGPTNQSGYASVTVNLDGVSNIALREVPQEGYIPFSLNSENDFSAEFYCHIDVLGYDNQELVGSPYNELVNGATYYCVAWNVPVNETDGGDDGPAPFGPTGGNNGGSPCGDGSCETRDSGPLLLGITPAPPGYDGGQGGSGGSGGSGLGQGGQSSGSGNAYEGEGGSGGAPTEEETELMGGSPGENEGGNCALLPGGCTPPEGGVELQEEFQIEQPTGPTGGNAPTGLLTGGNAPWLAGLGGGLFLLLFFLFALKRRKKEEEE